MWTASFIIVGPEYISIVAAEAKRPRVYIKTAFKTVYYRFGFFFIGAALACGIVIAYSDPTLVGVIAGTKDGAGAAASPFVIAMSNLKVKVFPDIINALLITSIFSAGNTYTYCATRSLYGLAIEGRAPKILRKCTNQGVPIYCFAVVMVFPLLSLLAIGNGTAVAIDWLVNLVRVSERCAIHCLTDQSIGHLRRYHRLRHHVHHLSLLLPSLQSARRRPEVAAIYWILPAVLRLDTSPLYDLSFRCIWLQHVQSFRRRQLLRVLRHDLPCADHLYFLEGTQEDKSSKAGRSRSYMGTPNHRRIRGDVLFGAGRFLD